MIRKIIRKMSNKASRKMKIMIHMNFSLNKPSKARRVIYDELKGLRIKSDNHGSDSF